MTTTHPPVAGADAIRECIEPGCHEPAGTPWTDHWCLPHDEERRERITKSMKDILADMGRRADEAAR